MFSYILTILITVVSYIIYSWRKKIAPFSHIKTNKYALPYLGHTLRIPLGVNLITFLAKMFDEVQDKTRLLWVMTKPEIQTMDVKMFDIVLKSSKYVRKGLVYNFFKDWLGSGLLISHGEKWQMRRKLLTPAFHFNILSENAKVINDHTSKVCKLLEKIVCDDPFDISIYMKQFSLNVICESSMGIKFNVYDTEDNSSPSAKYVKAIDVIVHLITNRMLKPWIHNSFIYKHFSKDSKIFYENVDIAHNFVKDVIEKRIEHFKAQPDKKSLVFLDILVDAYRQGQIDIEGIIEEVNTSMFEGYDTVSSAISWTLYLLGRNETIQNKLFDELKQYESEFIEYDDMAKFKYLECVIKESLRLHPPVSLFLRHFEQDTKLENDFLVPAGSDVLFDAYHMHRDESIWPNALSFIPERFQDENLFQKNPFSYVPFSAGPRNCIGQRFAMMELKIVLVNLVKRYMFKSIQDEGDLGENVDIIHRASKGIWVKCVKRQ